MARDTQPLHAQRKATPMSLQLSDVNPTWLDPVTIGVVVLVVSLLVCGIGLLVRFAIAVVRLRKIKAFDGGPGIPAGTFPENSLETKLIHRAGLDMPTPRRR